MAYILKVLYIVSLYSNFCFPEFVSGTMGCICGHEMTHGFDDIGREYDANGNRNGWWSPRVISQFKEHAACIEDMFSSFSVYGHHINGKLTLGNLFFSFFPVFCVWSPYQ